MSNSRDTDVSRHAETAQDRGGRCRQQAAELRELAEDEALEGLRSKLLDLAASYDETAALLSSEGDHKVLRARPVEGEIDYAGLTRDTVARFPKILAALAK
jgi:hypothetical protein